VKPTGFASATRNRGEARTNARGPHVRSPPPLPFPPPPPFGPGDATTHWSIGGGRGGCFWQRCKPLSPPTSISAEPRTGIVACLGTPFGCAPKQPLHRCSSGAWYVGDGPVNDQRGAAGRGEVKWVRPQRQSPAEGASKMQPVLAALPSTQEFTRPHQALKVCTVYCV
jgi:hypothetical protein